MATWFVKKRAEEIGWMWIVNLKFKKKIKKKKERKNKWIYHTSDQTFAGNNSCWKTVEQSEQWTDYHDCDIDPVWWVYCAYQLNTEHGNTTVILHMFSFFFCAEWKTGMEHCWNNNDMWTLCDGAFTQ